MKQLNSDAIIPTGLGFFAGMGWAYFTVFGKPIYIWPYWEAWGAAGTVVGVLVALWLGVRAAVSDRQRRSEERFSKVAVEVYEILRPLSVIRATGFFDANQGDGRKTLGKRLGALRVVAVVAVPDAGQLLMKDAWYFGDDVALNIGISEKGEDAIKGKAVSIERWADESLKASRFLKYPVN